MMINSKENQKKNCNNTIILGSTVNSYFHCYNNEDPKCGYTPKVGWMNEGREKRDVRVSQ